MARAVADQAEGLRRIFVSDARRMVALVSGADRALDSVMFAQLAAVLAGQGNRVLLLDEALLAGQNHAAFDARTKQDLQKVLAGDVELSEVLAPTQYGVDLLAGGARTSAQPRPRMEARIGLVNAFYRLAGQYDVVLVHAGDELAGNTPSFALACQDVIMSCSAEPAAMTRLYARMKTMHQVGERRFHLLFDGVDESYAQVLFRRIASVSRRHLRLMPGYLGALPEGDPRLDVVVARLADQVQTWPLPDQQTGHFPALMRRLLSGHHAPALRVS